MKHDLHCALRDANWAVSSLLDVSYAWDNSMPDSHKTSCIVAARKRLMDALDALSKFQSEEAKAA